MRGEEKKWNGEQQSERPSISIRVRSLEDGVHPIDITRDAEFLEYSPFQETVTINGTLEKEGDRLHVHAVASANGHFECTRCTESFERVIKAPLTLEFVPPRLVSDPEDENVHLYDPIAKPYIDITEDVRDALALAIPMKHLCRENCKGLCPTCGKDLNQGECDCALPEEISGNWSALNGLRERLRAEESKGLGQNPQRK